jgi:hypothetical protein
MLNVSGIPYLFLYWGFVGLALCKLCIQRNNWKEWLFILIFGIAAVCCWKQTDDRAPLLLMLGVCCSKNVDLKKLLKVDMIARIFSGVLMIALPLAGLAVNHTHVWEGGRYRDYFGWEAANGMGLFFLIICMEWMYLRHRRFKWYDYLGMLAIVITLDVTANSRFSELLILGIMLAELATEVYKKIHIPIEAYVLWTIGCAGALFLAILAPIAAIVLYYFQNEFLMGLSGTLSARFQLAATFFATNGISLFGHAYNPDIYDYLDMSFAYLLLHLGVIITLIVLILMIRTIIYAYREKDERLLLLFFVVLVRCILESEHFNLIYAFFPVLLGLSIWNQESNN